ncbi:MAG: metallophosphoesterase [Pseudomonadota bacterium]
MISRRTFLKGILALGAGGVGLGGYALAEPYRLAVTRYAITPAGWPAGLKLKLAVIADLHACEPFMGLSRIAQIVARTNALNPDVVLMPGDFAPSNRMKRFAKWVPGGRVLAHDEWVSVLAGLDAPLGVHAVLGNHDWWDDIEVQRRGSGPVPVAEALKRGGISFYENDAVRLEKNGQAFWLAGLGDQWAFWPNGTRPYDPVIPYTGVHDVAGTLAKVTDDAPVLLMAHEPDIFAEMGDEAQRIALTVSGHTHGGQVRLAGYAPIVPSRYGRRFVYGHVRDGGRHLIVSGGLGCSGLPVRFGSPPEIVLIELGE